MKPLIFALGVLFGYVGGCSDDGKPKPEPPQTVFQCTARVQHIEYHGDREHAGDWYIIVFESPEHAMWTIKVLYTYPPVWEGLAGEMRYEVSSRERGEYKNLVVLRRDK